MLKNPIVARKFQVCKDYNIRKYEKNKNHKKFGFKLIISYTYLIPYYTLLLEQRKCFTKIPSFVKLKKKGKKKKVIITVK